MKTNRTIEMPKIITSNLPEERLPNVTEFFNKEFGFASKEINYNNEFLKSLDAISESPVFVTVKNSENLIKDYLTGVYNKRYIDQRFSKEAHRNLKESIPTTVIMADIDSFKKVNDTYGHLVGDMVLKEIAATIQKTIRHVDIPARYGGEEFTIILPETAALNAVTIAERLRTKISEIEVHVDNETIIRPTVSIGISEYPNASEDIKELIDWADKALYVSKENGKNCIHLYFDGAFTRYNP